MQQRKLVIRFLIPIYLLLLTCLTGCVHYDVGVNFQSQTYGTIVQHIKLSDKLTSFSRVTAQAWLDSIEQRTRQLRGKTKRVSKQELTAIIPFYNGADLANKFNDFFGVAESEKTAEEESVDLPELASKLGITQNNLILALRNRLDLDIDLRSLGVLAEDGNVLVSPGTLLELEFSLSTPWGGQSIISEDEDRFNPEHLQQGNQLIWILLPGKVNHIEAVFWVPSAIGIGALIISVLVFVGIVLKSQASPVISQATQD